MNATNYRKDQTLFKTILQISVFIVVAIYCVPDFKEKLFSIVRFIKNRGEKKYDNDF